MKAEIDQISFNKLTLEFILFISIKGAQHQIPIGIDHAQTLLCLEPTMQLIYAIESPKSSDFVYYIFNSGS